MTFVLTISDDSVSGWHFVEPAYFDISTDFKELKKYKPCVRTIDSGNDVVEFNFKRMSKLAEFLDETCATVQKGMDELKGKYLVELP